MDPMNYNFTYERKAPGLIFILCDLSQKMARVKNILEATVRKTLEDYINGCICGYNNVADRIHISLIGYGNKTPYIIKRGWASEWVDTLIEAKRKGMLIIKECFENELECERVWELTQLLLDNQVADIASNSYYMVYNGMSANEALAHLNELWESCPKSKRRPYCPDHGCQIDFIKQFELYIKNPI